MKASGSIEGYLRQIRIRLHLDPGTESRVVGELATYFEEKTAELESVEGLDPRSAEQAAIRAMGPPRDVARLMYEAHSRGSWLEALLACQPHLFFAALCATHLWSRPLPCAGLYLITLFVSYSRWRRGRPAWVFPWIGYAFAPLLAGGLFLYGEAGGLFGAGGGATPGVFVLLLCLCAAGLWLFLAAAARALRRDWLLLSLWMLPWPVLALWLLNLDGTTQASADAAAVPAVLLLAGTAALFLRVRSRLHRGAVLAVGGVTAALVMAAQLPAGGGFGLLVRTSAVVLALLFLPALLPVTRGAHAPSGQEEPQGGRSAG